MSTNKKLLYMLILIFTVNLLMAAIYTFVVFAEEIEGEAFTETKSFNAVLMVNGQEIKKTEDERYYLNDAVDIIYDESVESALLSEAEIRGLIAKLQPTHTGGLDYFKDEYRSVSYYDGTDFKPYEDVADTKITLTPGDGDEYNRTVLMLRKIVSYKIYEDSEDNVVALYEEMYISPIYQIIFDKTAPVITGNIKETEEGRKAVFTISDKDGIKNLEILRNGTLCEGISLEGDERIIEYEYEIDLNSTGTDYEEYMIKATDLAGNNSDFVLGVNYDIVPPSITISGVADGSVYPGADVTVSSQDNGTGLSIYYKCVFTNSDGESSCIENSTWGFEKNGADSSVSGSVIRHYSDEGVYDISAFAYDNSGNYSEIARISFGVDSKSPEISIDNVVNNGLYNDSVTLYAVLNELFYNGASVITGCTVTDENGTRDIKLSPFEIGAKINKNVYLFTEEGKYSVNMSATDAMGHKSETAVSFTIDKSAPEFNLYLDDENMEAGNMIVSGAGTEPNITVDALDRFTEYETFITLARQNKDGTYTITDTQKIVSLGRNINFKIPVSNSGAYVLKLTAVDEAGNKAERNVEFTIDNEAPVIGYLSSIAGKYVKSFVLPGKISDYIEDMTDVNYRAYLNSNEISSCEIDKDGRYILTIVAEDAAGNRSEENAAFIVDSTAPKVIVSGIDSEGTSNLNSEVKLTLFDGDDYFDCVTVNGKRAAVSEDMKEVHIPVSEYGEYTIDIKALDYAGNETIQTIKTNCIYKANPFAVKISPSDIKTLTMEDEASVPAAPNSRAALIVLSCIFAAVLAVAAGVYLGRKRV